MPRKETQKTGVTKERLLPNYFKWLLKAIGVLLVIFTMYTGFFGPFEPFIQRGIFLSFPVFFSFIIYPFVTKYQKKALFYIDIVFAMLGVAACLYVVIFNKALQARAGAPLWIDVVLGCILIVLLLDAGRRSMGLPLPIITVILLLYTYFGPWMPDLIAHRGATVDVLSSFIYLTPEGIWGIPVAVAASFLFLFVLFGTLITEAKTGDLILDLAYLLAGNTRGGPAKVAIVASACFGTISGAAVANVVSTGSFTIPLMKRVGYPAHYAGAVEAVASTGGIIMPPVMGAAAFIMADLMDVNYFDVVKAAILPGALYFVGLFAMIHLRAIKLDLKPMPYQKRKSFKSIFKQCYLLIPAIVLIWFLIILRKSPALSAFYGNLAAIGILVLQCYNEGTLRKLPSILLTVCYKSARILVVVGIACALAGVIIGCTIQSGLAIRFSTLLSDIAGNNLIILLIFSMLAAFILGIGVTASVAYIIPAILVVPSMIKFGVSPMAANMFCFYYAVISYITPPVALAAYAAAGIAESNPFKTGYTATQLGLAGFILPYMFVYNPSLILEGNLTKLFFAVPTSVLGMVLLSASLEGWVILRANIIERLLLFLGAISLIKQGLITDTFGIAIFLGIVLIHQRKNIEKRVLK